jgi:hypothetical protein
MTLSPVIVPSRRLRVCLLALALALIALAAAPAASHAAACTPPVTNPVACENTQTGADPSTWRVDGDGDSTIQGFATSQSVNKGDAISFKIKSSTTNFHIDILRIGYYGGDGARVVASSIPKSGTSTQPACTTDTTNSTGLIDCGNWSVTASWTVPSNAVSGVYIAHLVRNDTGGDSEITFVVRDDSSTSDVIVSTSDSTWNAYNSYGGNSLYVCTVNCPPGNPAAYKAAYKVSYNRPLDTEDKNPRSAFFNGGEFPMVKFLEANGYNVSYTSSADVGSRASLLLNHKLFISSGHDEYWSASQRSAVEAARNAGVNLAFFSGNEVFWRTRWEPSSSGQSNRTLVAYKDTHFTSQQDPVSWTGTWQDPRFASASDNVTPQNALTGQQFVVNEGTTAIKVPAAYGKLRLWRGTQAASLTSGQTLTLAASTLGYEWDVDADNGFRPVGQVDLSSTTASGLQVFTDYGSTTVDNGTKTHNLTMYRAPSGALVFGAGTVQWSWGLDADNAGFSTPDRNMQQATLNLFADMGVQPYAPLTGLTRATQSTDHTAPTATITSVPSTVADGTRVTIAGTAADSGGLVAGVEISTDGGTTWHPATGTTSWTYSWIAHGTPTANIKVRATDDSANTGSPGAGANVTVTCPCSIWGTNFTPPNVTNDDPTPVEVGVKFRTDTYGAISGVRFYKMAGNTGTHTGSLWSASGQRLAQATFSGESATGWQTVTFASPVVVVPGTTYVASYYAPNGGYAATADYMWPSPAPTGEGGAVTDGAPLHALKNTSTSGNGVYTYNGASTFPSSSYNAGTYWVDVMFSPIAAAGTVTGVTATAGRGSADVSWTAPSSGGAPTTYTVTPYIGSLPQTPKVVTGTPPVTSTTVSGLSPGISYTFKVQASNPTGAGPQSTASNAVTVLSPVAPNAPTGVTASPASGSALVSWTAPSFDGGSAITGYTVTPYIGATAQTPVGVAPDKTSVTVTGLTIGTAYTFKVTATNAIGSTDSAASAAVSPEYMIFDLTTPSTVDALDGSAVELGVKFKSDVGGQVAGVRFYKAAANTGTHVGSLWTSGGTLLARATFTSESASGWQNVTFSTPVAITAGTTYVASYLAPNGHYSAGGQGLTSAVDNGPLHTIANASSANGVYAYSGASVFPSDSWNATNYYVDVMFEPTLPPGQVTGVTATAGNASASVSWTAPSGGAAPSSYEVTPYIGSTAQTTKTVSGSPLPTSTTVAGLTAGSTYTFKVRGVNGGGNGPQSAASNAVTVLSAIAPSAPTGVTAEPASGSARVSWTAPSSDGGSAITGYTVTPYIGGAAQTAVPATPDKSSATVTGLTNGTAYTFRVTATNAAGSTQSTASAAVTPAQTIFDLGTPSTIDGGDGSGTEVGVKFKSDASGLVTGVRFYKATANTGTHVGSLWTAGGTLLARATFTGETASGWQSVAFATPVDITAGTTYVASYFAPNGHYSHNGSQLASAVNNPPLHTIANGVSANGVYAYTGAPTFPNNDYNATNYWADVMFQPMSVPGTPTGVTATAGNSSATVSWTAPSGGGAPTSYEVTPYVGTTAQTPKTVTGSPPATSTTVTGLTAGTAYTFKVRAANANGFGSASAASNSVTVQGAVAPSAPTGVSVEPASAQARVSWTAPSSDGGSALTSYTVTPFIGSTAQTPKTVTGSPLPTSTTVTGLTNGTGYTFKVTATNAAGSTQSTASATATPANTLFDLGTPSTIDAGDPDPIELGVKFKSDAGGQVTGVRFYKATANTGTHIGSLWSATGTLLARATFTGESASGWQSVIFSSPVAITAGTTYVVSYFAPNGHYSATGSVLSAAIDNPPLHTIANGVSPNGVYAYNSTPAFPNNDFNATNYWVDALFQPGT